MNGIFWILIFLCGCGAPTGQSTELNLVVTLPQGLSDNAPRKKRFEERVRYLNLKLESNGGVKLERQIPPKEWERIALGDLEFPANDSDSLKVHAEVWDLKANGQVREYAVMSGKKTITANEFKEAQLKQVMIKLASKLSVKEYD